MNKIQMLARSDEIHPVLESHLLKMPQTIAGLALLFELIDGGMECIGVTALQRALVWAEYLQTHARRLYSPIIDDEIEGAHLILKRRNKLTECFTAREILRKNWAGLDSVTHVNETLECLVEYRYLHAVAIPADILGGRPTTQYCWKI